MADNEQENWEKHLSAWADNSLPLSWARMTVMNITLAEAEGACSEFLLNRRWLGAWGLEVKRVSEFNRRRLTYQILLEDPYEDEDPLFKDYEKRIDRAIRRVMTDSPPPGLLGEVVFGYVNDRQTRIKVEAKGKDDDRLWLLLQTFLRNWMDERRYNRLEAERPAADGQRGGVNEQTNVDDWKTYIPTDYWFVIDMWREGYTGPDIANTEGVTQSPRTIQNIVSKERRRLEKKYGKEKAREIVPNH